MEITDADVEVGGPGTVKDAVPDVSTHIATPELSHPGESASNGLAERSVGVFMDQLRTLKTALESRLKIRLASSHPITHWLLEHTSYVLNMFLRVPAVALHMVECTGERDRNEFVSLANALCGMFLRR